MTVRCFLCLLLATTVLPAQEEGPVTLDLEGVPLTEVVPEIVELTGRTIVLGSTGSDPAGDLIWFRTPAPIPRDQVLPAFHAMLEAVGLVARESGTPELPVLVVQRPWDPAGPVAPLVPIEQVRAGLEDDHVVACVRELEHYQDGPALREELQSVLEEEGANLQVLALEGAPCLILQGRVAALRRLDQLIGALDRPPEPVETVVLPLSHSPAGSLVSVLRASFPDLSVQAEPRTNSIIVAGDPERLDHIMATVRALDVEVPGAPAEPGLLEDPALLQALAAYQEAQAAVVAAHASLEAALREQAADSPAAQQLLEELFPAER
jgi:type II secretory pathway component GspD/PulD (secretin)